MIGGASFELSEDRERVNVRESVVSLKKEVGLLFWGVSVSVSVGKRTSIYRTVLVSVGYDANGRGWARVLRSG